MSSLFQQKEMTFLETENSKPNCKQQTVAASIFAHFVILLVLLIKCEKIVHK